MHVIDLIVNDLSMHFPPLLIDLVMFNQNIITGPSGDVCRTQMHNTEEKIYFGRYFGFIVNLNSNNKVIH